jgi:FeS assembly protein IscX
MGLHWDATYALVRALVEQYPDADVESLGLRQLYQMIIALPGFEDDPTPSREGVLEDILGEWYEEVNG